MMNKLAISLGKLKLQNPVMVASGTFGYGEEFAELVDLKKIGAIVTKTITMEPRGGNAPPRTCETPSGMLNSIGLENPGIDKFISEKMPALNAIGVPVIVSISAEVNPHELVELASKLNCLSGVAGIELNISCPNIKQGRFFTKKASLFNENRPCLIAQEAKSTYNIVKSVRKITKKPLITKLSPNDTDITEIALAAERAGSDALCLINTLYGMSIDVEAQKPKIAATVGGLSGPSIRPIAVRMVWEVYKKVKIPIIGTGGIIDTASALEFFLAGARAVSVGTANFINPAATVEIIKGIEKYLRKNKIKNIKNLTGSLKI